MDKNNKIMGEINCKSEKEPLLKFSFYLSGRNNIVVQLLNEIIVLLDEGFKNKDEIDGIKIEDASTKAWFWILGAYEVIRTIHQAKQCFTEEFLTKTGELKKQLAIVRMPSAKMEEQGTSKSKFVDSNRSPDGWDILNKDLLVGDPAQAIPIRQLFKEYDNLMMGLKPKDILKRHEEQ